MESREVLLPRLQRIVIRIKKKKMPNGQRTPQNLSHLVKINQTFKKYLVWVEIKLVN
jgi:hypothetical protein